MDIRFVHQLDGWPVLVVVLLTFLALVLAFKARRILLARASKRWPKTPGILMEHSVRFADVSAWSNRDDGFNFKDPSYYVIRVKYAYEVDGVSYESERLTACGSNKVVHSRELEDWIRSLPTRANVDVSYDPDEPSRATLLPGKCGA